MGSYITNKAEIRKLFPVTEKHVYLDHSAVSPVSVNAASAANDFLEEATSEAAFVYDNWMEKIEHVRKRFSDLIGSDADEIAFVRNTSHGISLVASGLDWKKGDSVIVYKKEFPSNIYPWLNLESAGVDLKFIEPDNVEITLEDIKHLCDDTTRLVSISSVQFTTGFRVDLKPIGEFCRENNILFFVDAIQSLGIIPIDVKDCNIDFLAADGHKWMLSPEGTGIFYCNREIVDQVNPSLLGWKTIVNEFDYEIIDLTIKPNALKFEEGSLPVAGIAALGASLELLMDVGIENVRDEIHRLGGLIIDEAKNRGFHLTTPEDKSKRGGAICFSGPFDPATLRLQLREKNIMVNVRGGGLRVSPHFYNTDDEILALFTAIDSLN
ncbi:MAG: aminotransferase class V-fold PLP-dependent enzyme [Thermodesulfobacteriota bacterium]